MNITPKISIIIPAYNAALFIKATIESVLNQVFTNWELIVVDDGSKDQTAAIVKNYLNDKRIKLIEIDNAGVSNARNIGIAEASGNYIAFLDADDLWHKDNLSLKEDALTKNTQIDFVFSNVSTIDLDGKFISNKNKGTDINMIEKILLWEDEVFSNICSNVVVRKNVAKDKILFDTKLSTAADQDMAIQLCVSHKGICLPNFLVYYRLLPNSMSRNIKAMEEDSLYVYKKAAKNKLFKNFWFKQKCFSNMYLILAGSWYVNGKNKWRGIYFIIKSLVNYPFNYKKLISKLF